MRTQWIGHPTDLQRHQSSSPHTYQASLTRRRAQSIESGLKPATAQQENRQRRFSLRTWATTRKPTTRSVLHSPGRRRLLREDQKTDGTRMGHDLHGRASSHQTDGTGTARGLHERASSHQTDGLRGAWPRPDPRAPGKKAHRGAAEGQTGHHHRDQVVSSAQRSPRKREGRRVGQTRGGGAGCTRDGMDAEPTRSSTGCQAGRGPISRLRAVPRGFSRFYRLKTGHCPTGQYLQWTKNRSAAQCWWCRCQTQMRDHLFKVCPEWTTQQKILWAEIRKESGRGKDRYTIRGLLADARCSQAVLDFLSTTGVGRRRERGVWELRGARGVGRGEEGGGGVVGAAE